MELSINLKNKWVKVGIATAAVVTVYKLAKDEEGKVLDAVLDCAMKGGVAGAIICGAPTAAFGYIGAEAVNQISGQEIAPSWKVSASVGLAAAFVGAGYGAAAGALIGGVFSPMPNSVGG